MVLSLTCVATFKRRPVSSIIICLSTKTTAGGSSKACGRWEQVCPWSYVHIAHAQWLFVRKVDDFETLLSSRQSLCQVLRVGQNRIYTSYMTVYMVISLPKLPYTHRIYMVLANPTSSSLHQTIRLGRLCVWRSLNLPSQLCMCVVCLMYLLLNVFACPLRCLSRLVPG